MTKSSFYIQLTVITLISAGLVYGLSQFEQTKPYVGLGWLSLALFTVLTLLMFVFGYQTAQSKNKNTFTSTVLGFTAGKMFMSLIVIVLYNSLMEPPTKWFILPFFMVYLIYTVFETYFMMRLGKMEIPLASDTTS
ncbi:MAG: hypothetical protein AAF798_07590 [Bacteroidota bacterium]